jgi:hypothetical protein
MVSRGIWKEMTGLSSSSEVLLNRGLDIPDGVTISSDRLDSR